MRKNEERRVEGRERDKEKDKEEESSHTNFLVLLSISQSYIPFDMTFWSSYL